MAGRSWVWLLLFMLLISACAGPAPTGPAVGGESPAPAPAPSEPKSEPAPVPPPPQAEPTTAPVREEPKPPAEPVREEIPGGFQVGGPEHLWAAEWLDDQRLRFRFSRGQEYLQATLAIGGGPITAGPVPPTRARDRFMSEHLSPDGTRTVGYGKSGPGLFIDLRTGAEHRLPAPGFYGSTVFDSWALDGNRYLVQAPRTNPVPGFYFMDGAGKPAASFHEPGFYSHRARWSPDSRWTAFLSVPIGVKYPSGPEGWDEPPYAPRLGILDVKAGRARYFSPGEGQAIFGFPVWSPDSARVAFACGHLVIEEVEFTSGPPGKHRVTSTEQNRVCEIDVKSGTLRHVTDIQERNVVLQLIRYTPDGAAVLVTRYRNRDRGLPQAVISMKDGRLFTLSGEAVLVSGPHLAVVEPVEGKVRLALTDLEGKYLRTLAEGVHIDEVKVSPDGRHLAFRVYTERSASLGPTRPYIVVQALTGR